MLYVGLTIKVKVEIPGSFKVGWYPPKITGSSQLKWLHSFVPSLDRNPLDSEFCRNIIESVKGQKSQLVMKKKPVTTDIIRSILDIHNKENSNLKNLRIAALCSLAFAGFFRYDVLFNIVPKHIETHRDYIRIFVPRSKKDVYREGNYVFMSAPRSKYYPVGVLQRYLDLLVLTYLVLSLYLDGTFFTVVVLAIL